MRFTAHAAQDEEAPYRLRTAGLKALEFWLKLIMVLLYLYIKNDIRKLTKFDLVT